MAAPFYNNIKGTTAGTPGTGAFTPNTASTGYLARTTVPTGWWGLVRYEDGSAWELQYSYWSGTTLSRSATAQFVSSSTGSALTLTSSATAALVLDANSILPNYAAFNRGLVPVSSTTLLSGVGLSGSGITTIGTLASASQSSGTLLTQTIRNTYTSLTTANASAGLSFSPTVIAFTSSSAGLGGWEFGLKWGCSTIPTGPRLALGMTNSASTFNASASDPSAATTVAMAMFAKDSGDTNIQLMTGNGTTVTKTNTGIPLVAGGAYESVIWSEPGSLNVGALLVRVDTGAIWYKAPFSTTVPLTATALVPTITASLSATTGTAIVFEFLSFSMKGGF